ncbi:metal ABC transporter ATP-binding protein [Tabrizicola sp. J26]|uniref:metal ABC transporter ATP-binding protein n=1 Tax=Alitabrizicola rongguiensis TaxID=2909234 RepID=UPI001F312749|nr:metal ABC transporter ATP-binding protein [Tabrizicola rongguiensis]MCF1707854.1 metal ABC transporter ATP-binding protein [Tabrizicola rongguiensis]
MSLLSAANICVRFGETEVLHDVSLKVDPGEIVTIVGPNGSGKSTLLRALLGIVPVAEGSVVRQSGLRIGYVPQRLQIDRSLPMTAQRFLSLPERQKPEAVAAALRRVGVPETANRMLTDLSGGQLQRVLFARALLAEPEILVLDEPTQGLDQPGEAGFYRLIEAARKETGAAVLMVSHDLHVVMAASDRVICLNGHICCEGTPHVVSNAPEYRALFGLGTHGALALYQHVHDHDHTHDHGHDHSHEPHHHDPHPAKVTSDA